MLKRSSHKHDVGKDLLLVLESGAMLATDAFEPGRLSQTLSKFWRLSRHSPAQLRRSLNYLESRGFIEIGSDEVKVFRLTPKGQRKVRRFELSDIAIPMPLKWDGKWRIVLFDVPEGRKSARNALSIYLRSMGFTKLQDSVWVHPYPCEEQVGALRHALDLSEHVRLVVADSIENDTLLREHFHLSI